MIVKVEDTDAISRDRLYLIACLAVLGTYLFPYFYMGKEATLLIHDNLDSIFVSHKILLDSASWFTGNTYQVNQLMNGLPRSALPSEFSAIVLFYKLFGPYGAYVANQVAMRLVAFFGMYYLLKRHIVPGRQNEVIHYGVALCFSLLPFWPFGGLSVAGMPLVLHAYLNIRESNYAWHNWFILILYPAYSSLILSGFFLLVAISLLWIVDLIKKKKSVATLLALVVMSLAYIFTHYRLFLSFIIDSGYISHRSEMVSAGVGVARSVSNVISLFINGQYHAYSLQKLFVLPIVLIGILISRRYLDKEYQKLYFSALGIIVLSSVWYGILRWDSFADIKTGMMALIPIQLNRFYFLHPVLWMILFAISLGTLQKISKKTHVLVAGILFAQLLYAASYHEIIKNRHGPSIGSFYAEHQFKAISDYIGLEKSEYRVASLGIHPSIAQYNGFFTLDGYLANYPLVYKNEFKEIIKGELEKSAQLKKYFETWGSRAYMFSSELKNDADYLMNKAGNDFEISSLSIDKRVFRDMGGRYILSAVRINQLNNPGIIFVKSFKMPGSAWDIYLYEVE